jgi:hypothetical protein
MLTPHCARNYGGVLQAYALQTVLSEMGHEPQIVNLVPESRRKDSVFPMDWRGLKPCVYNLLVLLRYGATKRRMERFAEFSDQFLRLSAKEYGTFAEIQEDPPRCDAYVCGSDQLWRLGMHSLDAIRAYFMDFVRQEDALKIAYAPSFGVSSISVEYKRQIKPFLDDIKHLSVRERAGQAIIEEITGRKVPVVLDPTLLLKADEWATLAVPPRVKPPYVLVYCQSQRQNFYDLVREVKNATKLPVVVISLVPYNRIPGADHVFQDVSFPEYLGLFSQATCVCTNSFHGTVFSLIHKRPFWTVPHESANSRIADLLERVGLTQRQVAAGTHLPKDPLEIDYSKAGPALEAARLESMGYLKAALSDEQ